MNSEPLTLLPEGAQAAVPLRARVARWGKRLSKFVVVQLVVQAVGVACGILLVRALSQTEYAFYTVSFAMQSAMNVLADSGVGIGLSSIGGRVWQDPHRFGRLVATALRLRRALGAAAVLVVAPLLVWMLRANGASLSYAALLTLAALVGLRFQLKTVVLMVVPRLCSQLGRVQTIDFSGALVRLALVVAAYFIFLDAAVATLATAASVAVQYMLLRRWTPESIDTGALPDAEDRAEMVSIIRNQLPNSIFYCLQGQVTIWLIAIFGSAQNVAEVGALGRLGVAFAVIGAVMTSIVLPGFARCQSLARLRRTYFQIAAAGVLFGLSLMALARFFPDQLLWVLGAKYAHLREALFLMMTMTALNAVITGMWALNQTKAWIKYSWLNIPAVLLTQALLLLLLDTRSLDGVLWFGILSLVPTLLLNAMLSYRGLTGRGQLAARSVERVAKAAPPLAGHGQ